VLARHRGLRVAVITQTNAQADDFCDRLAREFPNVPAIRFAAGSSDFESTAPTITIAYSARDLPPGPSIVVATASKWALSSGMPAFDTMVIDEAWQMTWATLMQLDHVAPRFVFIGDPGQIEPTVTVDTSRWETSRRPPHHAAPQVVLRDPTLPASVLRLLVSTRLPCDTVELVRGFYDFHFDSWAAPGEGAVLAKSSGSRRGIDGAIDRLRDASMTLLTVPTPDYGPPDSDDPELAATVARLARQMLARRLRVRTEDGTFAIGPDDIGITATHHVMNARIVEALGDLAERVRVDTPERWQGLELQVMIAVHPLSGVLRPSEFDLETGRLCVMASRHRGGLVLLGRDHIGETLARTIPSAAQPVGRPDVAGRGHAVHSGLWERLHMDGHVVAVTPV
jgi:hypothetical protein